MTLLDRVRTPADLKRLTRDELRTLCDDERARLIDVCSRTGGHIGAGLGTKDGTRGYTKNNASPAAGPKP